MARPAPRRDYFMPQLRCRAHYRFSKFHFVIAFLRVDEDDARMRRIDTVLLLGASS